jgi:DNA modification methylase
MHAHLFGARLLELREGAGLTLRQLAGALGVDHTYLSHLEGGRRAPSDDFLERLAVFFNQDLDLLRLQAGQIPSRLLPAIQRQPQRTLSLLSSLVSVPSEPLRNWHAETGDVLGGEAGVSQIPLAISDSYERPPFARHIDAGKNTPVYNAHSYHTKVPYQGILPYVEHYTDPGDVVLDPFCGSGMTGVAAILSGRNAILNDLSPAAVHIARNYVTPCDPAALEDAFGRLAEELAPYQFELYGTECAACGGRGLIEYTVVTDVLACGSCGMELQVWTHGRDATGRLVGHVHCSACGQRHERGTLRWLRAEPCVVSTTCLDACAGARAQRAASDPDVGRWRAAAELPLPSWVPETPFGPDWEMWRQGHAERGIRRVRDFFTERNLRALAAIHARIAAHPEPRLRAALLFAFTGCVNRASKRYQWNQKRPTNVLSGTLYVSSLFYEFNVFRLFERKVRAATRLFTVTAAARGRAAVIGGSAVALREIPDASIDYVFTDPPFGSNIYYADCSLLWEAWLNEYTDRTSEIVINRARKAEEGGKRLNEYQELLTRAFKEIRRVLKPGRWASVVFHNSSGEVWEAVRRACVDAGFTLGSAVMFDKRQKSFKGLKGVTGGERVANYDVVLNLQKRTPVLIPTGSDAASEARIVEYLRERIAATPPGDAGRRSTAYLHSLAIQRALEERLSLRAIDMKTFEQLLDREFVRDGLAWGLGERSGGDAPADSIRDEAESAQSAETSAGRATV